ncbi:hypothetical protein L2E82_38441 [Cichorium intybus]|uniref:Uncharacterized protein n=1 Tax=Cichorium intybus TaxID=13427 RepID=A0ACB9AGR3_CICIN|nr:hypothetical protein L2E82_38441 [Cichorium intybus]
MLQCKIVTDLETCPGARRSMGQMVVVHAKARNNRDLNAASIQISRESVKDNNGAISRESTIDKNGAHNPDKGKDKVRDSRSGLVDAVSSSPAYKELRLQEKQKSASGRFRRSYHDLGPTLKGRDQNEKGDAILNMSRNDAVIKQKPPWNLTEISSSLGLAGYYGRIVENCSLTIVLLTKLKYLIDQKEAEYEITKTDGLLKDFGYEILYHLGKTNVAIDSLN